MEPRKRVYTLKARRKGRSRGGMPNIYIHKVDAYGPMSALRRFRWKLESEFGTKSRDAYPTDDITIEEE